MKTNGYLMKGFVTVSFLLCACGYHFTGGGNLPRNVQTIFVSVLENRTGEIGLESRLTNDIINEFVTKRPSAMAKKEGAESVLTGVIYSVRSGTISRTSLDRPVERRVTIAVSLKLEDGAGKTIWSASNVTASETYPVGGDNTATDLNRRNALVKLSQRMAERIYNRMTDDF